jgi:hypothetical protein
MTASREYRKRSVISKGILETFEQARSGKTVVHQKTVGGEAEWASGQIWVEKK